MPTRNVVLTDKQEEFVGELVEGGYYQNASEVLREGLRLLAEKVERRQAELLDIKNGIIAGYDQIENSDFANGSGKEAIERALKSAIDKRGL